LLHKWSCLPRPNSNEQSASGGGFGKPTAPLESLDNTSGVDKKRKNALFTKLFADLTVSGVASSRLCCTMLTSKDRSGQVDRASQQPAPAETSAADHLFGNCAITHPAHRRDFTSVARLAAIHPFRLDPVSRAGRCIRTRLSASCRKENVLAA
jgi:hypothetical protein